MPASYHLVYFPYLTLRGTKELRYGRVRVWNSSLLAEQIADPALRDRVTAILQGHRGPGGNKGQSQPLKDIGVVGIGADDLRAYTPSEMRDIIEFRTVFFLACLSSNTLRHGPNAGSWAITAENFSLLVQQFSLESPYIAESSGIIINITRMGYKIGEVTFPAPSYVPQPLTFDWDAELVGAMAWLRRRHRRAYRRIVRAAAVFLESYYNTPSLDLAPRVLLQVSAFEILLDLPDKESRKVFKDSVERLCNNPKERRYRHKFEAWGKLMSDTRTLKGIWADRFYTLRNALIHGDTVHPARYVFRGVQHQLVIAPLVFVLCVKRLIMELGAGAKGSPAFFERLDWRKDMDKDGDDADEETTQGFSLRWTSRPSSSLLGSFSLMGNVDGG